MHLYRVALPILSHFAKNVTKLGIMMSTTKYDKFCYHDIHMHDDTIYQYLVSWCPLKLGPTVLHHWQQSDESSLFFSNLSSKLTPLKFPQICKMNTNSGLSHWGCKLAVPCCGCGMVHQLPRFPRRFGPRCLMEAPARGWYAVLALPSRQSPDKSAFVKMVPGHQTCPKHYLTIAACIVTFMLNFSCSAWMRAWFIYCRGIEGARPYCSAIQAWPLPQYLPIHLISAQYLPSLTVM
jgi:hypothetical protein